MTVIVGIICFIAGGSFGALIMALVVASDEED